MESVGRSGRVTRALTLVVLHVATLPGVLQILTLARLFGARLRYPLDIEWMESSHIYLAWRVSHGIPIYVDPQAGFVPFPYPPLYWVVVGLIGRIAGLDYATGRAVSIASVLGCVGLLGWRLVRHAPTMWLGVVFTILAAGTVAAGYPITAGSYDFARTDSFATFVALLPALTIGEGERPADLRRTVLVAALLAGSLYAKQTNVFVVLWLVAFVGFRDRRRGVVLGLVTFGLAGVVFAGFVLASRGWFVVWLFDMSRHPIAWRSAGEGLRLCFKQAPYLPFAFATAAVLGWRRQLRPETVKWLGALGAVIAGALLAYSKVGGWLNLFVPVFLLSGPVAMFVATDALVAAGWERPSTQALAAAVGVTLGVILHVERYDPTRFIPTAAMGRAAKRFDAIVRDLDGEVVVTTKPFVPIRVGKRANQPIFQAFYDAANANIAVDYIGSLEASGARWIIVSGIVFERELAPGLERSFDRVRELDVSLDSPGVEHIDRPTLWRRRAP